jgi:hypothetical protein
MISALLTLKFLGILFENLKAFAKLLFDMPGSYQSHMMFLVENLTLMLLVVALSFVKLL